MNRKKNDIQFNSKTLNDNLENIFEYLYLNRKFIIIIILSIALAIRLYAIFFGYGANHYSKVDELEAYQFGMNLYYFSNARIFGAYLPGPWQSLIVWVLIKLTNTVYSLYVLFAIIGTWTTYLIYWLSKKVLKYSSFKNKYDKKYIINLVGLFSALFYAIMPWPVKFSVSFWNPHFFIPFITLFLGYFADVIYESNSKSILPAIFLLAVLPFFHMEIVYALIPIILFIVLRYKKPDFLLISKSDINDKVKYSLNIKYLFYGIVLSILIYIPFLYFDWKNNFYILGHYIKGSGSFYKFRPETFKIFSNIIIVMTDEISRFIGHNFNQYKYFLNRAFGHYIVGFLFILPSFIIVLFTYIRFFKSFIKDKIKLFIGYWIISTAFFHVLSGMPHELRYTIIWFPFLILIINYEIVFFLFVKDKNETNNSKKFDLNNNNKNNDNINKYKIVNLKAINYKKLITFLYIFTLATGFYLNLTHFYQERYPNYKNTTRLIPSLIVYEKVKKILLKDYFESNIDQSLIKNNNDKKLNYNYLLYSNFIKKSISKFLHYFNLKIVNKRKTFSLYYYFPLLQNKPYILNFKNDTSNEIKNFKNLNFSDSFTYYLSTEFLFLKFSKSRQKQILNLISRFINSNINLIVNDYKKAKFFVYFIDKKYLKNKIKTNEYKLILKNKDFNNKDNNDNLNNKICISRYNLVNMNFEYNNKIYKIIGELSNCFVVKRENK